MDSLELEIVFNAIFDAEEDYGAEYVDVIVDYDNEDKEKIFIMYHDRHNSYAIKTFDFTEHIDIQKVNDLCDYLDLGFDNYL